MLTLIRFPLMDKSDFSRIVVPMQILTNEELTAILLYFIVEEGDRVGITPGIFNGTRRLSYMHKKESTEYVAVRLTHDPTAKSISLLNNECYGRNMIPSSSTIHSIRMKVSVPIWITSIGVPQYYYQNQIFKSFKGKYEIRDVKKMTTLVSEVDNQGIDLGENSDPVRFAFAEPVFILPSRWYGLSCQDVKGKLDAAVYKTYSETNTIEVELDTKSCETVKFEFDDTHTEPWFTGLKQGFLPTIGFKTH